MNQTDCKIDVEDETTALLDKALAFAKKAHAGQKRKIGADAGKDYIIHPYRVFQRVLHNFNVLDRWSDTVGPAALLHDVIEDGFIDGVKVTEQTLLDEGFSKEVVDIVKTLSRNKETETYFDFIMRVRTNIQAKAIKIADIEDNLSDLEEGSLKDKYRLARYILQTA